MWPKRGYGIRQRAARRVQKATVDQISAGHPIWFACDCTQFSLRAAGYFDCDSVRVDQLFGTDFDFDKAHGLEYGDSPSNHAMTSPA